MKKNRTSLFAIAGIVLSSILVLGCPSQDTKETTETQTTASDVTVPESVNKSEYTAPSEENREAVIKDLKTAFTTSGKTLFPDFSGAVAEDTSRTTVKEMTTMFEEQFDKFRSDLQYGKAELDINKAPGNIEELPDGVSAVIPALKLYLKTETEMSGIKASANACASGKFSVDYTKLYPETVTEFKSAVFNASGSLNGDIQANMVTEGETTSTSLNITSGNMSMAARAGLGMVFALKTKTNVAGKIVANVSYAISADKGEMQVVADKAAAGKMGSLTKKELGALVSAAKIKVDVYTLDDQFAFNWVDLDGFDEVYDFIEKIKRSIVTSETPEVTE